MNLGWICLSRSILEWEWYKNNNVKSVFIHCMLKANYEDKQWQGIDIKRGEFVTSLSSLAEELGLSVKQVRTALDKLEKSGEIERKRASSYTHIKCCNYSLYQDEPMFKGNEKANEGQREGKRRATTNNNNKYNKYNKKGDYLKLKSEPAFDISEIAQRSALNDDFDI